MAEFVSRQNVFSTRWGHEDPYTLYFSQDELRIQHGGNGFFAICKLAENGDPEWSGYQGCYNPLINIFHNDMIYPPDIVPDALEWAWRKWRNSEVSEAVLSAGLDELFNWIDCASRNQPKEELWGGAF